MNKFISLIALILCSCISIAQTPFKGADYIYYYQLGVGKTNGSLTTPSAWLEIGKDSTNKGLRLPRVVDTANVSSPVYGLQVYQIKDNSVYFRDKLGWRRSIDANIISQYLPKSDSTTYYPYWSNPRNYISTELDPSANAKTIRWIAGTGINVSNGAAQPLSSNPVATISAQNTTALWNANQLQGTPISATSPTNGQFLQYNGTQYVPVNPPASGTVTSVGLSLPSAVFNITGSPVTTSGTLFGSFKPQVANQIFASPDGISGTPAFRSLTYSDFPSTGVVSGVYGSDSTSTRVTVNNKGIITSISQLNIGISWDSIRRKPNSGNFIFNQSLLAQVANFFISGNGYVLGKLGIGSNTPSYKVGIRDTSTVIYKPVVTNNNRPVGVGINIFNSSIADSVGSYFIFSGQNSGNKAQQTFIGSITSAVGFNPHFIIGQSDTDTSYIERFRLDNTGKIGIGTTSPTEQLHVVGNIVANAQSYTSGGFTPLVRNNTTGRFETTSVGGSGTVTSVAIATPSEFSVSGSPVTTSGTITISKATQSANTVYSGPTTGGAAAPTFRALVAADIPVLDAGKISTGTIQINRGGTGLSTLGTSSQQIRVNSGATALEYFTPKNPIVLKSFFADETGSSSVMSYTVPNTYMLNNGDFLEVSYGGTFAATATTHIVGIAVNGDNSAGNLSNGTTSGGQWRIKSTIIRVSNTTVRVSTFISFNNSASAIENQPMLTVSTEITGLNISTSGIPINVNIGAPTSNVTATLGSITFYPGAP